MSVTRYAISWIYGEFRIAHLNKGVPDQHWTAPYPVNDLVSLGRAMGEASEYVDITHGGDLAIVYEDDLHSHDFFAVPFMGKKDLEKLLARKVENSKLFEEDAAWCYHEAKHENEEEGILLHLLPQSIVNSTVRICQEFYLTPRRLVPLTEVISEYVKTYQPEPKEILVMVALFSQRIEIVIALGDGEALFVRELPYSGYGDEQARLVTDINRTIQYCKRRFGAAVDKVWLLGEQADQIHAQINNQIEAEFNYDPESLDPTFWAMEVSNLTGQLSANFIPLLARRRLNSTLMLRVAVWLLGGLFLSAIGIGASVEYALAQHSFNQNRIQADIATSIGEIERIENLIAEAEQSKQKLALLRADTQNLPALFTSYLGDLTPAGLILTYSEILPQGEEWKVTLKGTSKLPLSDVATVLSSLESALSSDPWNLTITENWKASWYEQLRNGSASSRGDIGFEIVGLMK